MGKHGKIGFWGDSWAADFQCLVGSRQIEVQAFVFRSSLGNFDHSALLCRMVLTIVQSNAEWS